MSRKPAPVRQSTITKVIKGLLKAGITFGRLDVRPDGSFSISYRDGDLVESSYSNSRMTLRPGGGVVIEPAENKPDELSAPDLDRELAEFEARHGQG
jgi:hypothetical protein